MVAISRAALGFSATLSTLSMSLAVVGVVELAFLPTLLREAHERHEPDCGKTCCTTASDVNSDDVLASLAKHLSIVLVFLANTDQHNNKFLAARRVSRRTANKKHDKLSGDFCLSHFTHLLAALAAPRWFHHKKFVR